MRAHPALAGRDRVRTLATTYFDTPAGNLHAGGATLRIRHDGTHAEQTCKLVSGASLHRGEWNTPIAGDGPDHARFPAEVRASLIELATEIPLVAVASARIERTERHLVRGTTTIAVAFDRGTLTAHETSEPVCELELELEHGQVADLFGLALELPLGPELQWSIRSKSDRCHALAQPRAIESVAYDPPRFAAGADLASGFRSIAWSCLDHLLANYPLVLATGAPEAVHQARVALRRLRVAMKLFGKLTHDEQRPILMAEAKAAAYALGPARDLFVLTEQVRVAANAGGPDASELLAHLDALLADATRTAQHILSDAPFQRLLLQLALWIEAGDWHGQATNGRGAKSFASLSAKALSRLHGNICRHSKHLSRMSDPARHRLRIDAKKLRYAADFLAPLWHNRKLLSRQARFATALSKLQDRLGRLNDLAVAAQSREQLFVGLEPIIAARLAAQLDEILDSHAPSHRRLVVAAQTVLEKASDAPPWWNPR